VKKSNGRRKAHGRQKKGRQARSKTPVRDVPAATQRPAHTREPASRPRTLTSTLRHIDWPALAILVLPLALMALLQSYRIDPSRALSRPAAWHGDITRDAMLLQPDTVTRTLIASTEPWRGDLSVEAMPLQPDTRTRTAFAAPELKPWHGELSVEAMPLQPDTRTRTTIAVTEPPPWHGDLSIEAMPLQPDTRTRTTTAFAAAALPPLQCVPDEAPATSRMASSADFSHALAAAARAQTKEFVIYNARYVSLAYPGGDTPPLYGVCTDVVVRAYRALGIDLQELIHASRLGRGDPSIDHRRVEVVRRFLTRYGTSLAISEFAEDYLPGDIVTYHRPEGRISQFHIAIVSDRLAPSGRPLVVHNRGWGPQLEDALFVDQITGHYRLSPAQVEAFQRTRAPRVSDRRRRTAESATTTRR
jgi:uncharacterized protein YijF (DUF1287 family)